MLLKFSTMGTCAQEIAIEIEEGKIKEVSFLYGCQGSLAGISKLVAGMDVEEVMRRLQGIPCQNGTSCPDQLARALKNYLDQQVG